MIWPSSYKKGIRDYIKYNIRSKLPMFQNLFYIVIEAVEIQGLLCQSLLSRVKRLEDVIRQASSSVSPQSHDEVSHTASFRTPPRSKRTSSRTPSRSKRGRKDRGSSGTSLSKYEEGSSTGDDVIAHVHPQKIESKEHLNSDEEGEHILRACGPLEGTTQSAQCLLSNTEEGKNLPADKPLFLLIFAHRIGEIVNPTKQSKI